MSTQSHSPQRSRKAVNVTGPAQASVRREPSPSSSLQERQRYHRTQSMPIVPPLSQIQAQQQQQIQASPTSSQKSLQTQQSQQSQRRQRQSPPSPESSFNKPGQQSYQDDRDHEQELNGSDSEQRAPRPNPHPQLVHSHSFSSASALQQQQQHAQALGFVRPIPVAVRVPGSNQFLGDSGRWTMTDDLAADIERADRLQRAADLLAAGQAPPGCGGVAYAGGAVSFERLKTGTTPPKNSPINAAVATLEREKEGEAGHASGGSMGRRATVTQASYQRERGRDANAAPGNTKRAGSRPLTPEVNSNPIRASPTNPFYQMHPNTPPALRRAANDSPTYPSLSSPARAIKNRTPDRSLPVQEEPDDHDQGQSPLRRPSPTPSSDVNPTNDLNDREWKDKYAGHDREDHDGEGTLVDVSDDLHHGQRGTGDSTEGDDGTHTPRSPSSIVFESPHVAESRSIHELLQSEGKSGQGNRDSQQSQAPAFDPSGFQQTLKKLQSDAAQSHNPQQHSSNNGPSQEMLMQEALTAERNMRMHYPQPAIFSRNDSRNTYPNWIPDFYQTYEYPDEGQADFFDDAAAAVAYYQQLAQGTNVSHNSQSSGGYSNNSGSRPGAPIPPTPHSQTTAPTPFSNQPSQQHNGTAQPIPRTLIPSFSPAPPGTPYPYPFGHVRRNLAYNNRAGGRVSSAMDPNSVQQELAYQMQMYAFNNGGMSDSTLSPSGTPYPGMGPSYNPFAAFYSQSRAFGRGRGMYGQAYGGPEGDAPGAGEDGRFTSISMRSSPSHLPVQLPIPPKRGRGHRKRENSNGHNGANGNTGNTVDPGATPKQPRVKPPPRVESTQPRDTSPELSDSSGEETAGEKYVVNLTHANAQQEWPVNGTGDAGNDSGEWISEDSEDEHDLLDLEYHPTYVSNVERRRKRWDQRWDDLVRAFQALDRETDATMVLLASPSHSNTLHSLSSRSIRRDASLFDGHAMNNARTSFAQIASQRRSARTQRVSLMDRLCAPSNDGDQSPSSTASREEDLKKALKTAIESIGAMRQMYEIREARWREEERRLREEREGMDLLLKQAFGSGFSA